MKEMKEFEELKGEKYDEAFNEQEEYYKIAVNYNLKEHGIPPPQNPFKRIKVTDYGDEEDNSGVDPLSSIGITTGKGKGLGASDIPEVIKGLGVSDIPEVKEGLTKTTEKNE